MRHGKPTVSLRRVPLVQGYARAGVRRRRPEVDALVAVRAQVLEAQALRDVPRLNAHALEILASIAGERGRDDRLLHDEGGYPPSARC